VLDRYYTISQEIPYCCHSIILSHKNKLLPLNQARKGGKYSPVSWNETSLGSFKDKHKEKDQALAW
jgi:hypothetical protein